MKKNDLNQEKIKDAGLALVLIVLIVAFAKHQSPWIAAAIAMLLIDMLIPSIYKPFAVLWYGLSNILAGVTSKILLTLIFYLLVLPIGLIRRISGADSMNFTEWKKSRDSVFVKRDHLYTAEDIENPY